MTIEDEVFEKYVALVAAMSRMQMALEAIGMCSSNFEKNEIAAAALEATKVRS